MVWSRGLRAGHPGRHAAGVQRRDVRAESDGRRRTPSRRPAGDLLWEYRRQLPADIGKCLPFPAINRNLAIYGTTIIDTSADDFVYALDATTGKLAWETKILDYQKARATDLRSDHRQGQGHLRARLRAEGRAGGVRHHGARRANRQGAVAHAHDSRAGRAGRRDVGRRAVRAPLARRHMDGAELRPGAELIYIGTSVSSPAPKFLPRRQRQKHLYHNSTLALRADTGKIVWYHQHAIDHWDLDHPFERLLVDTAVAPNAVTFRGSIHASRRGATKRGDRDSGQNRDCLHPRPADGRVPVGEANGRAERDRRYRRGTGAVTVNPEMIFTAIGQSRVACPGLNGGKNWPAGAYSPLTNTMYCPCRTPVWR